MFINQIRSWLSALSPDTLTRGLRVALTIVIGLVLLRLVVVITQRYVMKRSTAQRQMVVRKIISYGGFFLVLMAVLGELGVKLTALLGAAGIVGIAVGFASQTSVSNIISGLFLISEKPFAIGDVIRIGGTTTGIIQSIDLLSIKIRTFDNLFVRIPNEKILTSEVTNITRFPIRRMDIVFEVDYGQDLDRIHGVIREIAAANPWSLDEPEPLIMFTDFKDSGIAVLLGLWFAKTDFMSLKNSIMKDLTSRFAAEKITFAYPHRTIDVSAADGEGKRRLARDVGASKPTRRAAPKSRGRPARSRKVPAPIA